MKENLRIGYTPFSMSGNAYGARMLNILSSFGNVVRVWKIVNLLPWKRLDVAILNWTENELIDKKTGHPSYGGAVLVLLRILFVRLASRKVVFVRHNVYPHDVQEADRARLTRWVDQLESLVHQRWIHSGHLANTWHEYVPHPRYEWPVVTDRVAALAGDSPYYVIFGRILPYKGIHNLLPHLDRNLRLVICGPASDAVYLQRLRELAGPNVRFIPKFTSEAEAAKLVAESEGLILASSDDDMIVSGSLIYGVSMGATIFCVGSAFSQWLTDRFPAAAMFTAPDAPSLARILSQAAKAPAAKRDNAELLSHLSDSSCRHYIEQAFIKLGV
ncbi:hypothetical protein [uncultured Ramlibacter sp.]|uniref:hypothetical protein n=1 Tax=uncultured Ramlibacter sp. TaxID=260755 RepID=UPI00261C996F|nr:hypothetical protein [uncultured Ramlibacter sp.]